MPSKSLEFEAPDVDVRFRATLLSDENPDVVARVLEQLPLRSVTGHVVVSGEGFWMPTRIVHLGRNHMVQRTPGSVYLYAPGQTICFTYGTVTESARVNKFAQVPEEDLPALRRLGRIVWEKTVAQPRRFLVTITVRSAA